MKPRSSSENCRDDDRRHSTLIYWGVNVLALIVCDWLFDGMTIGGWGPLLIGAAVLGVANWIVKPTRHPHAAAHHRHA
jgi:hypothetical protein